MISLYLSEYLITKRLNILANHKEASPKYKSWFDLHLTYTMDLAKYQVMFIKTGATK